jgi:hypothetical protein
MIRAFLIFLICIAQLSSAERWSGYCIIEIDSNSYPQHIAMAEAVVGSAGHSPFTIYAHEKSVIRKNLDGSKYLWKLTMKSNEVPTLDYLVNGIIDNTLLSIQEVTNMITNLIVLGGANAARYYIANNISDWENTNED